LPVTLQVAARDAFVPALHRATGSTAHLARLDAIARAAATSASASGAPVVSDEAIYARLGLPFIPPELREDAGEIEEALAGGRFDDLVDIGDVRGMIHCHTVYSDGANSIEEMARAADALGMEYLTITDHSPAAHYANGVSIDALARQWDEIARVQERVKVRLLRGTESDILESGALDYPDHVLERFDVIIASIHSRFRMDEEQMTRRLVTAMRQPLFKVWGHALGRLVLRRDPIAARVEEVLDAIAESRAAIEVNGDPHRLDLAPRWIREARKRGIRFVISTDAHSVANLGYLPYGVWTARRGGLRRSEVLNTLPVDRFAQAVRPTG
jgi:DNA polymerase (family 10)